MAGMVFTAQSSWSVPASPEPFKVRQPDGTEISLRMRGDEWFSWQETLDGRPVVQKAETGFWVYAKQLDTGEVIGTDRRVGIDEPQADPFNIRPTAAQEKNVLQKRAAASLSSAVTSGTGFVPVILANFSDMDSHGRCIT